MWPRSDRTEKVGRHVQIKYKIDNWQISLGDGKRSLVCRDETCFQGILYIYSEERVEGEQEGIVDILLNSILQ